MARASGGQSVLSKHLRILDAFDVSHPFLSLTDISQSTGIPLSSVHRTIAELEGEGLIERLPDRTYRLGVRLWELASRTPGALGLREIARPFMQAVHARVQQHTQLSVMSHGQVLCIERLSTKSAAANGTIIGGLTPPHASAAGLVMLAYGSPLLVDQVVAAGMHAFTSNTITTEAELNTKLKKVRRDGYVVLSGHIFEESRAIAVPIFGSHDEVIAALAAVVPNDDTSPMGHVELLKIAAREISKALRLAYAPPSEPGTAPGGRVRPLVNSSTRSMEYIESLLSN